MSNQADKLFFWIIMAVIVLAIASLSYFTFLSKTPTPPITATHTKNDPPALPKKNIQKPKQPERTKKEKKKSSSPNKSSLTKKKDQEKIPPKNNPPQSTPPDTSPERNENVGSIDTLLEGLFQRVNSRAQMQYGQILIDDFNLLDGGMHIEVRATNLWSLLPQPYKLQVLQILANQYTLIACNVTRIINCSPDNIPSICILDSTGREVASHSSSRGPQIFE